MPVRAVEELAGRQGVPQPRQTLVSSSVPPQFHGLIDRLVEGDADAGRALDDVKELTEGQREQPADHRGLVDQGDEPVDRPPTRAMRRSTRGR